MQSGILSYELTSRVDIEMPTATNADGSVSETWATLARGVPAEVIPRESMSTKQAAGVQAQTSHLVRMRIRTDVTSQCRLVLGTRYLNILGPPRRLPEARPTELVMECLEVEG
jgi:head-tail adaptor